MKTIGIICAMDSEFALIKQACAGGTVETQGRFTFYIGTHGGNRVVASLCGIGKVNAAACAQAIISAYHPDYMINSGIAGGLSPRLHVLDFVVADELLYHDLEERLLQDYFPGVSRFPGDSRLNTLAREICAERGFACLSGRIVTGEQFVTDSTVKARIVAETAGDAVEMEGAAIGHVCCLNAVPFAVLRCISDNADDAGAMDFDAFMVQASTRSATVTLALIERL